MLDSIDVWKKALDDLPRIGVSVAGCLNFAQAIGKLTDKVQAGPTGSPGILKFNSEIFAVQLASLAPMGTTQWATLMATAWMTALTASTITPGTVVLPVWTASAVDIATLPSVAATITTVSAAKTALEASLMAIQPSKDGEKFAKAFRDATLLFSFTCIGLTLVPPGVPVPLPVPSIPAA